MMKHAFLLAVIFAVAAYAAPGAQPGPVFRRAGQHLGSTEYNRTRHSARVIGGWPSVQGEHSWLLQMLVKYEKQIDPVQCAATLLNQKMALSTAACFGMPKFTYGTRESATAYYDVMGDTPGESWEDTQNLMTDALGRNQTKIAHFWHAEIAEVIVHPDYNIVPTPKVNDLSLLRIEEAGFTSSTRGALVWPEDQKFINIPFEKPAECAVFKIAGWGADFYTFFNDNGDFSQADKTAPTRLHEARVPMRDQTTCMQFHIDAGKEDMVDRDDLICAGCDAGYIDPCFGDEGGPLWIEDSDGKLWQYGVISSPPTENACGAENYNWMYAAVHDTLPWMCEQADLADAEMCTAPASPVMECSTCADCEGCTSCSKIDQMENPNYQESYGGYEDYGYGYYGGYGYGYEYYKRTGNQMSKAVMKAAKSSMTVDESCQTTAGVTDGVVTWGGSDDGEGDDAAADNSMLMYGGGAVVVLIVLYMVFSKGDDAAE